jgi:hypothetical protein
VAAGDRRVAEEIERRPRQKEGVSEYQQMIVGEGRGESS